MKNKLKVLKTIAYQFNEAGIHYAIGGSVLLFFNGIIDECHDLDILIDEKDTDAVTGILNKLGTLQESHDDPKFNSHKFIQYVVDDVDIDIIAGFVIVKDGIEHDCRLNENDIKYYSLDDVKVPVDSLDKWRNYYYLMDRNYKVELIDNYKKDISTK